ncbi:MAG: reverse transcriptase-like protein, partial [Anaerolineae bacterium]
GYGSYVLIRNVDDKQRLERLEFGEDMTNNEAEYRTLIVGLQDIVGVIERAGRDPSKFSIEVRGDSRLIINQVAGNWKVKQLHLRPLCDRARELLRRFGEFELLWQKRGESVDVLGH